MVSHRCYPVYKIRHRPVIFGPLHHNELIVSICERRRISMNSNTQELPQSSICAQAEAVVLQERDSSHVNSFNEMNETFITDPADPRVVLRDSKNNPVTIDRFLQCKPLQSDISKRPGPGGRQLLYLSGECVTRTLNQAFGFKGWNLAIVKTDQVVCQQQMAANDKAGSRWQVGYTAHVRITHVYSGSFREDVGAGESIDKQLGTAVQHALKGSITDAVKRAARHFGEKLGNSLYQSNFHYRNAPVSINQALIDGDKEREKIFKTNLGQQKHSPPKTKPPLAAAVPKQSPVTTKENVTCQASQQMRRVSAPPKPSVPVPVATPSVSSQPPPTSAQELAWLFSGHDVDDWNVPPKPPPSRAGPMAGKRPLVAAANSNMAAKRVNNNPYAS